MNQFALSLTSEAWQPQTRLPPANLPLLPLALQWQVGNGCGAGDQQFAAPHGLAFAPDGSRLYVADTNNRRVQSLSVDGAWLANWSGDLLQEPVDMAVADDGTPLVLDALAQQVFRLEPDNRLTPLPMQTAFYRPRGLDRDNNGNLLIADTGGGRVVVIAPDGTVVGEVWRTGHPAGAWAARGCTGGQWGFLGQHRRGWAALEQSCRREFHGHPAHQHHRRAPSGCFARRPLSGYRSGPQFIYIIRCDWRAAGPVWLPRPIEHAHGDCRDPVG